MYNIYISVCAFIYGLKSISDISLHLEWIVQPYLYVAVNKT